MRTVFVDESGHTGSDLLSVEQPFYTVASVSLPEETCRDLIARCFPNQTARELKYKSVHRSLRRQRCVLDLLRELKTNEQVLELAVVHKRFALICKMVDHIVEPSMTRHGIDFYGVGLGLALSNSAHWFAPARCTAEQFTAVLRKGSEFLINPNALTILELHDALEEAIDGDDVQEHPLGCLALAIWDLRPEEMPRLSRETLDVTFTMSLQLMDRWGRSAGSFRVIHDASCALLKHKAMWDAIVSPDVEPTLLGWEGQSMQLPIGAVETLLESSVDWKGLQVADIAAGAFCHALRSLTSESPTEYELALRELFADTSLVRSVLPSHDFMTSGPTPMGERYSDPVEYFTNLATRVYEQRGAA